MLKTCLTASSIVLAIWGAGAVFAQEAAERPATDAQRKSHAAVEDYLREVEEIERHAAEARAAAKQKLLHKLGLRTPKTDAGLIGMAKVNGESTTIAFHYQHGRVFPGELIRERFHDGDGPRPSVSITLLGSVEVPRDMTIRVWHAAGGVSEDWGELFVGDRLLGRVGDDLAKKAIYSVKLPQGKHRVRWVLTGGYFRNNLLKFEDAATGELLTVSHDATQRRESGADRAREIIAADADPDTWPEAADRHQWRELPLEDSPGR